MPSPLLYAGGLYFMKSNSAILTRLDAASGPSSSAGGWKGSTTSTPRRSARPTASTSPDRKGVTAVLGAGPGAEGAGLNKLDDGFDASVALAGEDLYLRGRKYLYRISETPAR